MRGGGSAVVIQNKMRGEELREKNRRKPLSGFKNTMMSEMEVMKVENKWIFCVY